MNKQNGDYPHLLFISIKTDKSELFVVAIYNPLGKGAFQPLFSSVLLREQDGGRRPVAFRDDVDLPDVGLVAAE